MTTTPQPAPTPSPSSAPPARDRAHDDSRATLATLGEDLHRAFVADLAAAPAAAGARRPGDLADAAAAGALAPPRWRRKAAVIPAALALTGLGIGAAAAAGLFTPDQVASGMTRSLLFGDVTATCTTTDDTEYDRRLPSPPPGEPSVPAPAGKSAGATTVSYAGAVYEFIVDDHVAGGCRGQDAAGLRWVCYAGQQAVDEGIIGADFLGEYVPPGTRPQG